MASPIWPAITNNHRSRPLCCPARRNRAKGPGFPALRRLASKPLSFTDSRSKIGKVIMLPPLRVGVAGLGTVGASVLRLLERQRQALELRTGRAIIVTGVSARSRGRDRGVDLSGIEWHDDPVDLAQSGGIDLFVELIGGAEGPA